MGGKVSQEVRERYNAKVYEKVTFRLRKDKDPSLEQIKEQAENNNMSLNAYIVSLIKKDIEEVH